MAEYSIQDLEKLTGVKAHTIRMWEKRYGVVAPNRTDSNIRVYSDAQLKKLLNVTFLVSEGYKISKIASLPSYEVSELIKKHTPFVNDEVEFHLIDLHQYLLDI